MQRLDLDARAAEIANLPPWAQAQLAGSSSPPAQAVPPLQRTRDCAAHLSAHTLAAPERVASLLERVSVPDDYVTSYRLLGLYALSRYPFASGIRRFEAQRSAVFAKDVAAPTGVVAPSPSSVRTTHLRLAPPTLAPSAALQLAHIQHMLAPPADDPLRVPDPTPVQAQQLLAHFAPSFQLAIDSNDDRPGALVWRAGLTPEAPDTLEVDTTTPVVYGQTALTRYGGHSLLQLVYTLWFPARPMAPGSTVDVLAGKLDGITWRVTLSPDGTPLVYDTIHPCGCYHMFFPSPAARAKPAPQAGIEWAFIPQALPHITAQQQVVVHIAAGTHYIDRVSVEPAPFASTSTVIAPRTNMGRALPYAWRSYDSLRSLPTAATRARLAHNPPSASLPGASQPSHRSIFGPDGFIAGTDRSERFIFWPMGIPRAGAMRQWGKHATAFVGRRHFDDATLMEQRFEFDPAHFAPAMLPPRTPTQHAQ